ncbi:MAG: hypothetical protein AAGA66_18200 [Bacteroidota bacterium]
MSAFKLDDIEKKGQPFKAPDGYFEDLPLRIQHRIQTNASSKVSWYGTPAFKWAFSIATIVIVLLSVTFFDSSQSTEDLLAEIPEEELLAYVDQMSFDEEEILTAFEGDIQSLDFAESATLNDLDIENESLEDLMSEYGLEEEYL